VEKYGNIPYRIRECSLLRGGKSKFNFVLEILFNNLTFLKMKQIKLTIRAFLAIIGLTASMLSTGVLYSEAQASEAGGCFRCKAWNGSRCVKADYSDCGVPTAQ